MLPALSEAFEDKEEGLSARASGAVGGGLALDVLGGLNGRTCMSRVNQIEMISQCCFFFKQQSIVCYCTYVLTISLIPVSFPVGSLGLEEGRGGGTRAPAVRGVVGLFGTGTTRKNTRKCDWLVTVK